MKPTALLVGLTYMAYTGHAAARPRGAVSAREELGHIVLENEVLRLAFGKAENGAVTSLMARATGREYAVRQTRPRLFLLAFSERARPADKPFYVSSAQAGAVRYSVHNPEGVATATLEFGRVGGRDIRVRCVVSAARDDRLVRWRLFVHFPESLVLEEVQYPVLALRTAVERGALDALVLGRTKGGVHRRPSEWPEGTTAYAHQPGQLAAQFACYYDAGGGVYTAAYDAKGYPKAVKMRRTADGLEAEWDHYCFTSDAFSLDYDIVQTVFASPESGRGTDWRDAADIYKRWAERQHWCARTYAERDDVPDWMKAGPAMVRFSRSWLARPELVRKWLDAYWREHFPSDVPLIVAYWGWEKVATWVAPDYFPVYPSDGEFTRLVRMGRAWNCHAFAWPSGYHYTLTYRRRDDGTFEWDDRERFGAVARPHAVRTRDGTVYRLKASWLRGGENAAMCPGDAWTIDWLNDIAVQLAKRGVEMVQVDQVVGAAFPTCYSAAHGHPPGPGLWSTKAFRRQLRTMLDACGEVRPEAIVCFEEPNEHFIQQVGIQDYRDWEIIRRHHPAEPASVCGYLYHEYLPTFQSNPRRGDRVMQAYCLVNGQIPHLIPSEHIGPGPALLNGGFEEWAAGVPAGWSHVRGYRGQAFEGEFFRDETEVHGGRFSLRLQNDADDDVVQVSQNVSAGSGLRVGGTYRLSAWMKTSGLAQANGVLLATLSEGTKATGSWRIPMPQEGGDEWTAGEVTFTVPEGSALLRIMLHLS
ncbi:MAG: DUF6259 domain-containing protein, partial [Armatimonadota bacterium]